MRYSNELETIYTSNTRHFNHDESWFFHLNQIQFDLLLTLHFKEHKHYANTLQGDCNRRRLLRETFGKIASTPPRVPHRSLFYFGITELGCDDRMHSHTLVKIRKDIKGISSEELIGKIHSGIDNENFRLVERDIPRSVEVVKDSTNTTNYILKIKTAMEKEHRIKENYYHSKNFVQICKYMKQGLW
jgi:hypothetical protein